VRYADKEARYAFNGARDYGKPLALLEKSFRAAGLNIEFVGYAIGPAGTKAVLIYQNGSLAKQILIEEGNPAMAVKEAAWWVQL
jgi:hypothetical protein